MDISFCMYGVWFGIPYEELDDLVSELYGHPQILFAHILSGNVGH